MPQSAHGSATRDADTFVGATKISELNVFFMPQRVLPEPSGLVSPPSYAPATIPTELLSHC